MLEEKLNYLLNLLQKDFAGIKSFSTFALAFRK